MLIDVLIVRALHIAAGVMWLGGGSFYALVGAPAQAAAGEAGSEVFRTMHAHGLVNRYYIPTSLITLLTGLYLYVRMEYYAIPLGPKMAVFYVGALAGLLATGEAVFAMGSLNRKIAAAVEKGGLDMHADLPPLINRLHRASQRSGLLAILAILGMSLFRYV